MALTLQNQFTQPYPVMVGNKQYTAFTFAAVSSTALTPTLSAGLYRFNVYLVTTTGVSETVTVNVIYTDDQQAQTKAVLSAVDVTATGNAYSGVAILELTGASTINYSIAIGTGSTAVGNIYMVAERIF